MVHLYERGRRSKFTVGKIMTVLQHVCHLAVKNAYSFRLISAAERNLEYKCTVC